MSGTDNNRVGWQEVRRELLSHIGKSALGEKLPSAASFSKQTRASQNTVKRAFRDLEQKGFLDLSQGRRAVVVSTVPRDLRGLAEHSADLSLPLHVRSADVRLVDASADDQARCAASALRVALSEPLLLVDRVRSRPPHESGDARWERAYMPARLVPAHVLKMDFAGSSPASLAAVQLAAGLRRAMREVSVSAQFADEEAMCRLRLTSPAAVLRTIQVSVARIRGTLVPFEFLLSLSGPGWELRYNLPTRLLQDPAETPERGGHEALTQAT